jgi:hypothetical protein
MSDIFEATAKKYRNSPAAVMLFIAAATMFFIGANHFVEDTVSSKFGLETLQAAYNLKVQIFDWSYWTMSLAPQVASIVFFYMYLSDTSRKNFLALSFASQAVDFFADSWYRSNGNLFNDGMVFAVSSVLTFAYFSIGSEVFVTISVGLMLKLAAPAIQTWKVAFANIAKANNMAFNPDGGGGDRGKGGGDSERKHIPFPASLPRGQSPAQMGGQKPNGGTGPLSPVSRENRGKSDNFRR